MFIETVRDNPQYFVSWVGFAIFSICVHESAHARMAVYFGDETPRDYIPLNPAKQMGWLSIGLLLFIGVAWGAVPVSPHGCGSRWKNALVSLAGPLANLGLCLVFALLAQTARLWGAEELMQVFRYGSYVNGALCLLNLCPIPPLDGFGAIRSLVTDDIEMKATMNRFSGIGLLLLWMTPVGEYVFRYGTELAEWCYSIWMVPFNLSS